MSIVSYCDEWVIFQPHGIINYQNPSLSPKCVLPIWILSQQLLQHTRVLYQVCSQLSTVPCYSTTTVGQWGRRQWLGGQVNIYRSPPCGLLSKRSSQHHQWAKFASETPVCPLVGLRYFFRVWKGNGSKGILM